MENILSRKRQLPHLKLMLIYIYGVKWLIFIISTGIQVGHMTSAKPLLAIIFQENLILPKTKKTWNGLCNPNPVMAQAIVNILHEIKLSPVVMYHLAKRCESFNNSQIAKFKRSVINSQESQRAVNILNRITLTADSESIEVQKFFLHSWGLKSDYHFPIDLSLHTLNVNVVNIRHTQAGRQRQILLMLNVKA